MDTPDPGLKNHVACETKITLVDYDNGKLYYRGYDVEELVRYSSFEEVAWLLVKGELPGPKSLEWFQQELKAERKLRTWEHRELEALLNKSFIHHPLLALDNFVTSRGAVRPRVFSPKLLPSRALEIGTEYIGIFPVVIAHLMRWGESPPRYSIPPREQWPQDLEERIELLKKVYIHQHPELSHAANFLWMLRGEKYPTKAEERALNQALILHADHELNASTYSGIRGTASTGATPDACITAGIATLSGPQHGGANEMAMLMFENIGKPEIAAKWVVNKMVNERERIFGFGHRLYRHVDPRSQILKRLAKEQCRAKKLPWYHIALEVEKTTREILRSRGHSEDIPPNVDFWSPPLFAALGIKAMYMPLIFAMARSAGWTAHMVEQYENNMLIRPKALYTGHAPRPYPKK